MNRDAVFPLCPFKAESLLDERRLLGARLVVGLDQGGLEVDDVHPPRDDRTSH
jgi:hypothetical protein